VRIITCTFLFSLVACLPTLSVGAQSGDITDCPGSQREVDACLQRKGEAADHLLNQIYGIVMKELSAGPDADDPQNLLVNSEIQRTLIGAERQWVKFRDAQCALESALIGTGTAAPAVWGQCLLGLTQERIRFLRRVAEQIQSDSKLCKANKATCVLPADPPWLLQGQ
jgi:uncharacterized protein YecT (DUF1311 family)